MNVIEKLNYLSISKMLRDYIKAILVNEIIAIEMLIIKLSLHFINILFVYFCVNPHLVKNNINFG